MLLSSLHRLSSPNSRSLSHGYKANNNVSGFVRPPEGRKIQAHRSTTYVYIHTHTHTPCTPSKSVRIRQVSCRCFASDNLELHKRKEKRERKKYIFICRSVREVSHCNNFGFAWATEKLSTHIAQIKWNISARTCKHSCLSASFLDESLSLRSQRSS